MRPRDSLWSEAGIVLAGNVLARALGFLFPLVLARAVAKDDFGTVYFVIGTGFFVGELVLTGFPTAMTRFMAAEGGRGAWLSSAIAGGLPLLGVALIAGETLALAADVPAGLMSMVVVGLSIDAYYFGLLRGSRRFRLLAAYRVSANLAQVVLLVLAIALGVDSTTVAVLIYSFVYLAPILAIELLRSPLREALRGALRPEAEKLRTLARFSGPALVAGTAYAGIAQADVLYVGLLAKSGLADYAAAKSLAQPIMLVPYAIAIVMLPAVAAATPARRWRMLVRAVRVAAALGIGLLCAYLLGRELIVGTILPAQYAAAAECLALLAAGVAAMGVHTVMSQWTMGAGRPGRSAVSLVIGALVAAGLQFVLTPAHGTVGAATAFLCGALLANAILAAAILHGHRRAPLGTPAEALADHPATT